MKELLLQALEAKDSELIEELRRTFPLELLRQEAIALGRLKEFNVLNPQKITYAGQEYVVVAPGRANLVNPQPGSSGSWLRRLAGCDLLFDASRYPRYGDFSIS